VVLAIQELMEDYPSRSASASRGLRDLLDANPEQFVEDAFALLSQNADVPAAGFLLRLLVSAPAALDRLVDPVRFREQEAAGLARRMLAADPTAEVKLAQRIRLSAGGIAPTDPWQARRVLGILGQISDGRRILPVLTSLVRHPDPHVQSKATLLIGRAHASPQWLAGRLSDPDPRIRANAVEALWGMCSEDAKAVARRALRDTNHRVAANAAVALYRMGQLTSIQALANLLDSEHERFRAAGAWAMGETGDPRFLRELSLLDGTERGMVRQNILRSRVRIRERMARLESAGRIRLSVERDGNGLVVEVRLPDGQNVCGLPPTSFILTAGEQHVPIHSAGCDQQGGCRGACTLYRLIFAGLPYEDLLLTVHCHAGLGERKVR
jgi:HEAT repeat protein